MSRFETGGLYNRGRNAALIPQSPLESVGLTVPGLDVPPPVVAHDGLASSLLAAFGLADRASGVVANSVNKQLGFQRDMVAANEHATEQARVEAERNRIAAEGMGAREAALVAPGIASKIANSTAVLTPEQQRQVYEQELRTGLAGLPEASIQAGINKELPGLLDQSGRRVDALRSKARGEVVANLLETAATTKDPDTLAQHVHDTDPNISLEAAQQVVTSKRLEYAAANGDAEAFKAILSDSKVEMDQNYVQRLRTQLEASNRSTEARVDADARETYAALAGVLGYDQVTQIMRHDKRVQPSTIARFEAAAQQAAAVDLRQTQEDSYNTTASDVFWGNYEDPAAVAADIRDRGRLPSDHPNYLTSSQQQAIYHDLTAQFKMNQEQGFADSMVDAAMNGHYVGVVAQDHDASVTKALASKGVVVGTTQGDTFRVAAVADPATMASIVSKFNRVPAPIAENIQTGMTSDDAKQFATAATSYAAIYRNSPELAESLDLTKDAKVRARFVTSRLDNDPASYRTNESLAAAITGLSPTAVKYQTSYDSVDPKSIVSVMTGVPTTEQQFDASATKKLTTTLTDTIRSMPEMGVKFGMRTGDSLSIPLNVSAKMREYAIEEYKLWKSTSPQMTDQQAIEAANESASRRVLNEFQPTSWGHVVRFGTGGTPGVNGMVLRDEMLKSGVPQSRVDDAWDNYVPEYVNVNGKAAWQFRQAGETGGLYLTATPGADVRRASRLTIAIDPQAHLSLSEADIVKVNRAKRDAASVRTGLGAMEQGGL